jgi:hypothetical protein
VCVPLEEDGSMVGGPGGCSGLQRVASFDVAHRWRRGRSFEWSFWLLSQFVQV